MMNSNDQFFELHETGTASNGEESEKTMFREHLTGQREAEATKSFTYRKLSDVDILEKSRTQKSILIVEDDDAIGEFIMLALSLETSHRVVLAKDSTQALALARDNTWDLFILDYLLHEMNGITLFDRLHTIKGLEYTPALILSAANVPQKDIAQRNLYSLTKPLDLDDFLSMISTILSHHNQPADTPA
jgi:CheY-like chemotaxis protein